MKKLRSDSKWNKLPQDQRKQVLNWLFDDGLSYQQALKRARRKFGVDASVSSLKRFYCHAAGERRIEEMMEVGGSVEALRDAAWKVVGLAALDAAMDPRNAKQEKRLLALMKLQLKAQQQKLAADQLAFKKECRKR